MYLTINGIHTKKCTACSACIKDCPQQLFHKYDDKTIRYFDPENQCLRCGHCIAVCPADAVDYTAEEPAFFHPKIAKPATFFEKQSLYAFLRARRSIRQFKSESIDVKTIEAILDAMRHAPTASNKERITFTVVTNPALLGTIREKVLKIFRVIKQLCTVLRFFIPFGRKGKGILGNALFRSLTRVFERIDSGHDPILFHAPCCIILSSPRYSYQAGIDAGIALSYGVFAAQAEGLGTCLIGFVHEMLVRNKKLRNKLKIPKKNTVQGVMVLGQPAVFYKKAPPRKPLSAVYFN